MDTSNDDDHFVELLSSHQVRLRAYIFALVRDAANADDVLQNACMALWKKRNEYDPEREFFRWACGMSLIEVLRFRRRTATDKLLFDEVLINTLAAEYVDQVDASDLRHAALPKCLQKLSPQDRQMLEARYRQGVRVNDLAQQLGKPLSTVYRSLARIREMLLRCVQSTVTNELSR